MDNVVKIRRYRTHDTGGVSQFIPSTSTKNSQFEASDLAKSGLSPDDMETHASGLIKLVDGATAGYVIPYFDLKGKPLTDASGGLSMWRTKYEYPLGVKGPKYLGPNAEQLGKSGLSVCLPYVPPRIHEADMQSKEIICAEGEKKTAAIIKLLRLPAFGIGGCQMWRDPDGSGRPHPWILELLRNRGVEKVIIVPDGDIQRYDIATAYGTFTRALESAGGVRVEILHPPGKIDDLLVEWGPARNDNWNGIPKLGSDDLVQSTRSLINQYALAFKSDAKGNSVVYQHTSNIMRLMSEHPAFPRAWLDEDINTVMMGENKTEPHKTDMDVANYFQYNLGFHNVTDKLVHNCVMSLARTNRKSPFLDWVRSLEWDGQDRLGSWLNEYWGAENSEHTREIGLKWLVSACARMDKPGTKLDWMLITIGPQGTGKTSMPFIIFRQQARIVSGEQNDKDLHLLMHSSLCAVFDELDSFGRKEASSLKAMVTTHEDAFRPPYGISTEVFPRRFTLYGCGNRYEFLQHDPSGYRRYAVVEVPQLLDFKRLQDDCPQLWAEAWHRYNNDKIEYWRIENANAEAQKHVIPNLLEEKIVNWIEHEKFSKQGTNVKDGFLWFNMTTILSGIKLEANVQNTNLTREISQIIKALGAERTNGTGPGGQRGRWYKVRLSE